MSEFKKYYFEKIVPELQKELNLKNRMAVPKMTKVTLNVGIGTYLSSAGSHDSAPVVDNITKIAGQKPMVTKARKAISNFKLKEGMTTGIMVTLRGKRMYEFINKLVNVVLPRIRDFQGISTKSFDKKGNYNIGIKEYTVFPEIKQDDVVKMHGLQVCISTTARNATEGHLLFKKLGFPFKEDKKKLS